MAFVVIYTICALKNRNTQLYVIAGVSFTALTILFTPALYEFFIDRLLLACRTLDNPDLFFSYRLSHISNELQTMNGMWIFGKGCVYLDCLPIAITIQSGIVGALIVFSFLAYVAYRISEIRPAKFAYLKQAAILLFWSFMTVSIFEAHVPFGTGVKCFALWMTFGFIMSGKSPQKGITAIYTN